MNNESILVPFEDSKDSSYVSDRQQSIEEEL